MDAPDAGPAGVPADARVVARVGRPHGVRGEMRLMPESGDPSRLSQLTRAWLVLGGEARQMRVIGMRAHADAALATFEGVDDRDVAARWTHAEVWALPDELPAWSGDEFGVAEVVGLELWDGDAAVGRITGVASGGDRDFFEVEHGGRIVLVPAVKDWLVERNPAAGRIVMRLPAGLLDA